MWLSESFVTLTLTLWSKAASQFSHLDPEEGHEPAGMDSLPNLHSAGQQLRPERLGPVPAWSRYYCTVGCTAGQNLGA